MNNTKAYLDRIKFEEKVACDLDTLNKLQRAHVLAIPFENLDIHHGNPIRLDLESLSDKIITRKRGGFCYELNSLFHALLVELGFTSKMISAQVYDKEKGYGLAHDHLALVVTIDGQDYLTDVGFGEFAFGPLQLLEGIVQTDERGAYTIDRYQNEFIRIKKIEKELAYPEYIFKEQARTIDEFYEMCHYHQTNPASHFTQKRLISRPTPDGRITLTDDQLKIKVGSETTTKPINEHYTFEEGLLEHFGLDSRTL